MFQACVNLGDKCSPGGVVFFYFEASSTMKSSLPKVYALVY